MLLFDCKSDFSQELRELSYTFCVFICGLFEVKKYLPKYKKLCMCGLCMCVCVCVRACVRACVCVCVCVC